MSYSWSSKAKGLPLQLSREFDLTAARERSCELYASKVEQMEKNIRERYKELKEKAELLIKKDKNLRFNLEEHSKSTGSQIEKLSSSISEFEANYSELMTKFNALLDKTTTNKEELLRLRKKVETLESEESDLDRRDAESTINDSINYQTLVDSLSNTISRYSRDVRDQEELEMQLKRSFETTGAELESIHADLEQMNKSATDLETQLVQQQIKHEENMKSMKEHLAKLRDSKEVTKVETTRSTEETKMRIRSLKVRESALEQEMKVILDNLKHAQSIDMNLALTLDPIKAEVKGYSDALTRHLLFRKGVAEALERAKEREKKISQELEQAKLTNRKLAADIFYEKSVADKHDYNIQCLEKSLNSSRTSEELKTVREEANDIDRRLTWLHNEETKVSQTRKQLEEEHKKLCEAIERAKEEKRTMYSILSQDIKQIEPSSETQEIVSANTKLLRGIEAELMYITDKIRMLQTSVANESLALNMKKSEIKRLNASIANSKRYSANAAKSEPLIEYMESFLNRTKKELVNISRGGSSVLGMLSLWSVYLTKSIETCEDMVDRNMKTEVSISTLSRFSTPTKN